MNSIGFQGSWYYNNLVFCVFVCLLLLFFHSQVLCVYLAISALGIFEVTSVCLNVHAFASMGFLKFYIGFCVLDYLFVSLFPDFLVVIEFYFIIFKCLLYHNEKEKERACFWVWWGSR